MNYLIKSRTNSLSLTVSKSLTTVNLELKSWARSLKWPAKYLRYNWASVSSSHTVTQASKRWTIDELLNTPPCTVGRMSFTSTRRSLSLTSGTELWKQYKAVWITAEELSVCAKSTQERKLNRSICDLQMKNCLTLDRYQEAEAKRQNARQNLEGCR